MKVIIIRPRGFMNFIIRKRFGIKKIREIEA